MLEYPGYRELHRLESGLSAQEVEDLRGRMTASLKRKLQAIADAKKANGSLVVPVMGWQSLDKGVDRSKCSQLQLDEDRAIRAMGFLLRNYTVENWYFEPLEMMRKLVRRPLSCLASAVFLAWLLWSLRLIRRRNCSGRSFRLLAGCFTPGGFFPACGIPQLVIQSFQCSSRSAAA